MNKKELIKEIQKRTELPIRLYKIIVDYLVQNISTALEEGDKVTLKDFGVFYNTEKKSKRYYDIATGEIKTSSPKKVIKFVPSRKFKEQFLSKILDTHIENDGSIGDHVIVGTSIYSDPQNNSKTKNINNTNTKPISGKENIGQRIVRTYEIETTNILFDGHFLFDHYLDEDEHKKFPSLKVPRKNTRIIKPQTDRIGATTGVMEPVLQKHLHNICKEIKGLKLLNNIKLPILNRNYSYRPDFCLHWEKKKLYIDIEIDEPYDIVSRKPIHYTENGDNLRDRYFIRNGWCVIRFAEQQIKDNIEGVINYIKRILRWLTDENGIKFHENTLKFLNRWSYEDAVVMSSNNTRENYLGLTIPPKIQITSEPQNSTNKFIIPTEDILPKSNIVQKGHEWFSIVDKIKQSNCEYCIITRTNSYQWIYTCKSLKIKHLNEGYAITGQSPLGIDVHFPLDKIAEISPLKELFSDVHWERDSSTSLEDWDSLKKIIFDAIAYGKPIWMAYNSQDSGYSTRFLFNIASCRTIKYFAPHIGLGHHLKYDLSSISHFYAYCSNRKEFRMFAADYRIEKLKILNCNRVYILDQEYANSFAELIMAPYEGQNGNAFFENADEILHIMPKNEFESTFVQGNLANLQVMKGEIKEAITTYQQKPYDFFINPSITWGETCISDINFFINLCNEHLNDSYFYEGLDANIIKHNFEEVLRLLTKSSWMQDKT